MIYFDNIASTKPDQRVIDGLLPYLQEHYGNPSSLFYPLGRESYEALETARKRVANLIQAKPENIYFTSGGTESNNLGIKGVLRHPANSSKKHIILSETEHYAVKAPIIKIASNDNYEITYLKVDTKGHINIDDLKNALREDTVLVAVQHANPEIGTIQDIKAISKALEGTGAHLHVDGVYAAGHVPVDIDLLGADTYSLAGKNFYGVQGSGALYVRDGAKINSIIEGGGQEGGLRSGTENTPGIVALGIAADIASKEIEEYSSRMRLYSQKLMERLTSLYDFIHITGETDVQKRIPGNISFWVEYIEGEALLMWFAVKGIYVASGSACASNILAEDEEDLEASSTLTAVGVPTDVCAGSITMSLSKYNEDKDVEYTLEQVPEIIDKLCNISPAFADRNK